MPKLKIRNNKKNNKTWLPLGCLMCLKYLRKLVKQ